jgi:hypothetical protein
LTFYRLRHPPSRIDFFGNMQKGFFDLAIKGLDFAQVVINTARQVIDGEIVTAMNSAPIVQNARSDQNIRTAEITIPVIYADVITYKPGELGNNTAIGREGASVYYHPDALKDKEYLATVESSLISVGTHEKNTSENNKNPDGFVRRAYWDEQEQRVVMDAMAAGDREVTYVERNRSKPGFGASAFLKFIELKRASGIAPSGKKYDAIATKVVNDHVAIMDSVRDPRNMVIAMNAMEQVVPDEEVAAEKSSKNAKKAKVKNGGNMSHDEKKEPASKEAIRNTIEEMEAEKARNEFMKKTDGALNELSARMGKIESYMSGGKNGKNAGTDTTTDVPNGEETPADKKDDKDGEEAANAKNALPTEEVIADCADYLGMKFEKPPTFNQLGSLLGVKGKNFTETVTAVNAKRKEIVAARKSNDGSDFPVATAANAGKTSGNFMSALSSM